jgi:protein-S-isoprenylcysteine O-methyltransferase Ste14
MRTPIVIYSSYVLVHDVRAFTVELAALPSVFDYPGMALLARLSQWIFVALLAVLPLVRYRPIAKSSEVLPRVVALVTVCVPPLCLQFDRAPPNAVLDFIAAITGLLASGLAVVTVSYLGRSFSVMPEARRLVTAGPYSIVRHPLYSCEILGVAGIALQVRSLQAVAALVAIVALQVARASWEEGVLDRALKDFAPYRARVPLLIPRCLGGGLTLAGPTSGAGQRSVAVSAAAIGLGVLIVTALPRLTG